jgi:hypothetical protein
MARIGERASAHRNSYTGEAEAGELWVSSQHGLHNEILIRKKKEEMKMHYNYEVSFSKWLMIWWGGMSHWGVLGILLPFKKRSFRPGVVVHTCNLSYFSGKMIMVWGQPGQKVSKTLSQQIGQAWWLISVIPAMQKAQTEQKVKK